MKPLGMEAVTLTPFAYHSLMVQGGSATLPELISDRAIAFGLAATLGMIRSSVCLPEKNYPKHLKAMPYRTSVFMSDSARLLPPLTRRLNLDAEGGFQKKIQDVAKKGNIKDFFHIQEVPPGQTFTGAVFGLNGFDPFEHAGEPELVIRIGLHRSGMVRLRRLADISKVRLNAHTAALCFDRRNLPVDRYCLHSLQLTPLTDIEAAAQEVSQWN